jgi:hypothetical protein
MLMLLAIRAKKVQKTINVWLHDAAKNGADCSTYLIWTTFQQLSPFFVPMCIPPSASLLASVY